MLESELITQFLPVYRDHGQKCLAMDDRLNRWGLMSAGCHWARPTGQLPPVIQGIQGPHGPMGHLPCIWAAIED